MQNHLELLFPLYLPVLRLYFNCNISPFPFLPADPPMYPPAVPHSHGLFLEQLLHSI